ncbi:hypothetical protein CHS0354_019962 [Potamilus streckersoni]|uniref:Uncharacterized protein n=1 Tax=Potamilus streckersoni TaxID=2493646 RepID=A0AAE0S0F0_9BIVA|nr:hypothetical protein CHS0354_019962 [Potamilus streckersoni]
MGYCQFSAASCTTNPHAHRICYGSVSLHKKPGIETKVDYLSSNNQKAHIWSPAQTAVNQKRHTSCKVPIDPKEFIPGMMSYTQRQHRLCTLNKNIIFHYPEMPLGAKLNLCNAERIYSSRNLLKQKRKQYMQLLIKKNRGAESTEYEKYMRYINQSKTGPLPIKTGWRRPVRLPKLVTSVDSTKENGQKQQTPAEKTCPSSEVLQKSQSGQFENPKPESKREIKHELEKDASTKQSISIDQRVTGNRSHNRPSFLSSRNKPAISQTNSRLQQSTQREEDINLNEEPRDAIETGVEAKVHDKLQEDQKPTYVKPREAADEMVNMSEVHDSRPSTVLNIHKHVERPESGMSTSSKAVLSVLGHVGRPESETNTLSNGNGAEAQMNIEDVEYIKSKSGNKAESLVSIRSNDSQQIYRALGDMVDKDTDAEVSKYVHRERKNSVSVDRLREGNKDIRQARSDSEEAEDHTGERRGSGEIYGAQRDSVETEDEGGEAKTGSGEIHRVLRDSKEAEDDKGETIIGSINISKTQDDSIVADNVRRGNRDADITEY